MKEAPSKDDERVHRVALLDEAALACRIAAREPDDRVAEPGEHERAQDRGLS